MTMPPGGGVPAWDFHDRIVVVTDASSPRGAAQVAAFCAAGARVYACVPTARHQRAADGLVESIVLDMSVEADAATLAERISAEVGHLDVLVINDPASDEQTLVDMPDAAWQNLIAGSVTAGFLAAKHLAPLMFPRRYGKIVFTTGPQASPGLPAQGQASAPRHAIVGLARSLALEVSEHQVNVNVITAAEAGQGRHDPADVQALTHAVMWLASDAARFITGSVISAGG